MFRTISGSRAESIDSSYFSLRVWKAALNRQRHVCKRYSTPTTADVGKPPLRAKCLAGKSYFAGNRYRRCRCACVCGRAICLYLFWLLNSTKCLVDKPYAVINPSVPYSSNVESSAPVLFRYFDVIPCDFGKADWILFRV